MTLHNALANSELHEDKGVASANDQELYFARGGGSGTGDWKPLIYTTSWTYSSDTDVVEFTDLDEFAFVQIDTFNIQLDTSTNQHIRCQLGNDSGYSTSSIYYEFRWHSSGDTSSIADGLTLGLFKDDTGLANSGINCSSTMITNFNQERYTVACLREHYLTTTTFVVSDVGSRQQFVRERKAYNKLKVYPANGDNFTGGTITLTGWRNF